MRGKNESGIMGTLKSRVRALYTGRSNEARWFRYALIAFDLFTVAYFILTTPLPNTLGLTIFNLALLLIIAVDFACRLWIAPRKLRHLSRLYVLADMVVILSYVLNPLARVDLAFLRILRGVRLGHSEYLLNDLRRDFRFFRFNEDAIVAVINLVVFVFVTTCAVFVFFVEDNASGVTNFVDALYFTVTTLTTTGYGDLTPTTVPGKLAAIAIMVIGVALFFRLAATVVTPNKVYQPCKHCGLTRHDVDAVHCKHCGAVIVIETRGAE